MLRGVSRPHRAPLPVDEALPGLLTWLQPAGRSAVVVAPPGSGKTTRVPPALLDGGLAGRGRVVVLQPRRVAARMAARRIAWERGSRVGGEVGYRTRFDSRSGSTTRIEVVTEGLLLRWMQRDPFLEGVGCVVLDEFHERSLHVDLALALLREVQREVRGDLRIVVMSATLDPAPVVRFLGGAERCATVEAPGRPWPVEVSWAPASSSLPLERRVAAAVRRAIERDGGHVLVFLPGVGEIERARGALRGALPGGVTVLPLHGGLPAARQDEALAPSERRKVVLSTNIAETSVTLDGVSSVVDSGLARVPRFDSGSGLWWLERRRISRASAQQRAGRAGRTGPGYCERLWTRAEQGQLASADVPEIRRSDLAETCLQLLAWGDRPQDFGWFEPPPEPALQRGMGLLEALGAVDQGEITARGRAMAALPTHPRLARVLEEGARLGVLAAAAAAAALTEGRDPLRGALPRGPGADDLSPRLEAIELVAGGADPPLGADPRALRELVRTRDQLLRRARAAWREVPRPGGRQELLRALVSGLPDRVALRRAPGSPRFALSGGGGAELDDRSVVEGADLIVALSVRGARRSGRVAHRISLAVPIDEGLLDTEDELQLAFDEARGAVTARQQRRFGALVLDERPAEGGADPVGAARLLCAAAGEQLEHALCPSAGASALRGRVRFLRHHRPDLGLPDLDVPGPWLESLCAGRRSFDELRRADLVGLWRGQLDWRQLEALDRLAPAALRLPTGRRARLRYEGVDAPVLEARIQQLFGLRRGPAVLAGELPVKLHLLAPNGRPAQVTSDLDGFWEGSYAAVRRDLRGRYPKHSWPEDPLRADPEDRPRRRPTRSRR